MSKPIRVLQAVPGLPLAGTETWLARLNDCVDRDKVAFDFLVHSRKPDGHDSRVERAGAKILVSPIDGGYGRFARAFMAAIRDEQPYDVIHTHMQHFGGFVVRLAARAGIPVRIVQSHSDTRRADRDADLKRRAYLEISRRLVKRYATHRIGVSPEAALAMFGKDWKDIGVELIPPGVDPDDFIPEPGATLRAELGIGEREVVLGHVGRFAPMKNQRFAVDILAAALKEEPAARLVLVGKGPTLEETKGYVAELGLQEKVLITGARDDVPELMMSVFDTLLLPSLWEGAPVTVIEAQAAGLPTLKSDAVTDYVKLSDDLVESLPLSAGAAAWAAAALRLARREIDRERARKIVAESPFNVRVGAEMITRFYARAVSEAR